MTALPNRLTSRDPEAAVRFLGHDEHTHEVPHLIYVAMGVARITVDDVAMTLHPQESIWLQPHVPHAARYEPGSLVLGPFLNHDFAPPSRMRRLGPIPALTAVMTALQGAPPRDAEEAALFRGQIEAVLAGLSTPLFPLTKPRHPAAATIAQRAVRSPESLDELADSHGLSTRHVQRIFVDETGLPFRRWRVRARLNIAAERLHGGASPQSAAAAASYSTVSGLRKALHREAGLDFDDLRVGR